MQVSRFDYAKLKAVRTDEGYIQDTPVISRTGVFEYMNPDGSIRRELRLPEEVFNKDSLESLKGKPITSLHKGLITSKNVTAVSIGTVLSEGKQHSDSELAADIVIHKPEDMGDMRELSLGYVCDLEYSSGVWQNEKYDAIQRKIRYNHLSVVERGRAGAIARLNMDGSEIQSINIEDKKMSKLRLDNNIEYDAAPEVIAAYTKLKQDSETVKADLTTKLDEAKGKADSLQAKVDSFDSQLKKAREDAKAELAERAKLEAKAAEFKVDCAGKTDNEIKIAVIKTCDPKFDATDKSDAYIQARFDVAEEMRSDDAMAKQRQAGKTERADGDDKVVKTSAQRYDEQMASLRNK